MKNKNGFTLSELLIVVAIIAVIAVIAIPIFSKKLETSREEVDIANLRSAKSAAMAIIFSGENPFTKEPLDENGLMCFFDVANGEVFQKSGTIKPYGQGTESIGDCKPYPMVYDIEGLEDQNFYNSGTDAKGKVIRISLKPSGVVKLEWVDTTGDPINEDHRDVT